MILIIFKNIIKLNIFIVYMTNISFGSSVDKVDYDLATYGRYYDYMKEPLKRFNQQKMDPIDFYMSIFNPFFVRIPSYDVKYSDYVGSESDAVTDYNLIGQHILARIKLEIPSCDLNMIIFATDGTYCKTNSKYNALQLSLYEISVRKRALEMFRRFELTDYGPTFSEKIKNDDEEYKKKQQQQLSAAKANTKLFRSAEQKKPVKVQQKRLKVKELNLETDKTVQQYLGVTNASMDILNQQAFFTVQNYMRILPNKNESPKSFPLRHAELLDYAIKLNPYTRNKYQQGQIKLMEYDRVNKFKTPILLKNENYNDHVIRLKKYGYIAHHYQFYQNKYDAFKNIPESDQVQLIRRFGLV